MSRPPAEAATGLIRIKDAPRGAAKTGRVETSTGKAG